MALEQVLLTLALKRASKNMELIRSQLVGCHWASEMDVILKGVANGLCKAVSATTVDGGHDEW